MCLSVGMKRGSVIDAATLGQNMLIIMLDDAILNPTVVNAYILPIRKVPFYEVFCDNNTRALLMPRRLETETTPDPVGMTNWQNMPARVAATDLREDVEADMVGRMDERVRSAQAEINNHREHTPHIGNEWEEPPTSRQTLGQQLGLFQTFTRRLQGKLVWTQVRLE